MSPLYEQFREALLKAASPEHKEKLLKLSYPETMVEVEKNINLEDVLRVLREKSDYKIFCIQLVFLIAGGKFGYGLTQDEFPKWNLTKPAHEQSDETLQAIINLLS